MNVIFEPFLIAFFYIKNYVKTIVSGLRGGHVRRKGRGGRVMMMIGRWARPTLTVRGC